MNLLILSEQDATQKVVPMKYTFTATSIQCTYNVVHDKYVSHDIIVLHDSVYFYPFLSTVMVIRNRV